MFKLIVKIIGRYKGLSLRLSFPFLYIKTEWPENHGKKISLLRQPERSLKTGDVVFTRSTKRLLSVYMPSHWHHCGIYMGNGQVFEADGNGLTITALHDFLNVSHAIVGTPIKKTYYTEQWDQRLKALVGRPYNYNLRDGDDTKGYCCSELANAYLEYIAGPKNRRVTPDDVAQKMKLKFLF